MLKIVLAEGEAASGHLARAVAACPELQVVAHAQDVAEALDAARRLGPALILASPRLGGGGSLLLVRRIMAEQPLPVVVAGLPGDSLLAEAQALGAVAAVELPTEPGAADLAALCRTLQLMATVQVVRRWQPGRGKRAEDASRQSLQVIGIGASTGGPQALRTVLGGIATRPHSVPVLVVQHIAKEFLNGFAEWLSTATALPVRIPHDDMPTLGRTIYLAPDGFNMGITRHRRIRLTPPAPGQHFCPSIDHMFESMAESFGAAALGVLLTGMGLDGAEGLLRLRRSGGTTIAQDEASSAVFGMPKEAMERGAAERQMTPTDIAKAIATHV